MHILRTLAIPAVLLAANLPAQWVAATPATTVGPRSGHVMAADLVGNTVLFGGVSTLSPLAQTWNYDGATWTQLAPTTSPSGRTLASMAYDINRNVYVLFGGWTSAISTGNANNQTWEFDGADWTQITPTTSPGGLWKHAMAYDLARGRIVVYGGSANGLIGALANTWEYDGITWTQVMTAANPGPRERASMCYAATQARTVLFGGIHPALPTNNDTWTYDGTNWTLVPVVGPRPAIRTGARMAYDLVRGVCVLVGGQDPATGTAFSDTWEFDGATWTQIPASSTPGRDFGLAFDAVRRLMVRHGGITNGPTVTNGVTDEYGARVAPLGVGCAGSAGVPLLAASDAPRVGQLWPLVLSNAHPTEPFAVFVLGVSPFGAVPLDSFGMTGCIGYATPDLLVAAPATAGVSTWSLGVPPQLGLVGVSLYAQGISVDPTINFAGAVASNAVEALLGL